MKEHQSALDKAKIRLMSKEDSAFFTTVCFSLKHIWDENIPTACTNGLEIRFNPDFFMSLSPDERVFLLLHESMHVAFLHMARLKERNHNKWNIAADHVINLMLIERGFHMPQGGYADPQYAGMSTEQVYDLLPDEDAENINPDWDDLEPFPDDAGTDEDLQRAVEDILVRAAVQSKMQGDKPGTIPGDIEIFLNKLLSPKLPWHRILQRFLFSLKKDDYTFRRPNRRFLPDHYMPSLYNDGMGHIAIAVDTSGSVTDEDFLQFISEVATIIKTMQPEKISLIQFDTCIKAIDEIKDLRELHAVTFTGRGGTNIYEVIEWSKKNRPKVLLVFTDGYFHVYDSVKEVKNPLIWLIHNNDGFTAPSGKVIHYTL